MGVIHPELTGIPRTCAKSYASVVRRSHRRSLSIFGRERVWAKASPRVVSVGESLFDFIADQKGLPRDKVLSWTPYPGGAPCNVATALARLGVSVLFVTALGRDDRGKQLFELIESRGVDTTAIQWRGEPTRDIYVVRDQKGDREFAGFGLPSHLYCDCFLASDHLPLDKIKSADFLVTGTLGLASPVTRRSMWTAVEAAKDGGCKVFVDINWRPVFWDDEKTARKEVLEYLALADIVKISDADLAWLYNMKIVTGLLNPCAVADKLGSAQGVLVTAGEEGAAYCFKSIKGEHSGFVPVFELDVVDTTGAGDAFTAGFLYRMLEAGGLEAVSADPQKLKEAVVFAAACGALTCTKPGAIAAQPTMDECLEQYQVSKKWHRFW